MSALLHPIPVVPSSKTSDLTRTKPCLFSYPSTLLTPSLSKGFARVLASAHTTTSPKEAALSLPSWKNGKNETRSRDLRLHDAFLHLNYMVGKGHKAKANTGQATQLLYDLRKSNRIQKAVRVMKLIVSSGSTPESSAFPRPLPAPHPRPLPAWLPLDGSSVEP